MWRSPALLSGFPTHASPQPSISMDDISISTSRTDKTVETGSSIYNPSSSSKNDSSIAAPPKVEIPETDCISNPSSFPMDDFSITTSPTDEIPYNRIFASSGTAVASPKSRYNAVPRKRYTDIPRASYSSTDEIPETDSFIYNPSLAYSGTTIASYKTERTINWKSRYDNAFSRNKYTDIPKAVSELRPLGSIDSTPYVDAGPSQAAVQNVILIDSGARADRPVGSIDSTPYVDAGPSQAAVQNVIPIDSEARADARPSLNFGRFFPKLLTKANFLAKRRLKRR